MHHKLKKKYSNKRSYEEKTRSCLMEAYVLSLIIYHITCPILMHTFLQSCISQHACKEKESRQEIICLKRLTVSRKHASHQSMSYKAYPSRIDIYCSWIIRLNKICLIFKYKLNLKIVYLLIHTQRKYLTNKSKISYVSDHHTNVL